MKNQLSIAALILVSITSVSAFAADATDTSSIATGIGFDNYGMSLKLQYDTDSQQSQSKSIVDIKGIAGDSLGWSGSSQRDDSIDSVRARYFSTNHASNFGQYVDANYDVEIQTLNVSGNVTYLYQQGPFEVMPYAGAGLTIQNGAYGVAGYELPGSFVQVGVYAKLSIIEGLTFTYNPEFRSTLGGSDDYVDHHYTGDSTVFNNEVRLAYQITSQWDVQYHGEWNSHQDYADATRGVEVNYHF
ncbi:hypothetical protein [Vibrio comitans]